MLDAKLPKKLTAIPFELASIADYENMAQAFVDPVVWHYIQGGSGNEQTLRENAAAFQRYQILPRLLQDCSKGTTATSILDHRLKHPIILAPVAYQKCVHPQGEVATAQAAEATDTLLVSSTLASVPLATIAAENRGANWFQLYFQSKREHSLELIRQAEVAGYTALMVTLDVPIQTSSRRLMRTGQTLPPNITAANLKQFSLPKTKLLQLSDSKIFQGVMSEAPSLEDLQWLLNSTRLPVFIKGVLNKEDAKHLQAMGVHGIVVSNHGGRACDGSPATLDLIAGIRATLGDDFPLLLDSGIRSGYDVFKAIALGADAVMIGRPQLYGLAIAGALGVAHTLKLLRDELEIAMALAGTPSIAAVKKANLMGSPSC